MFGRWRLLSRLGLGLVSLYIFSVDARVFCFFFCALLCSCFWVWLDCWVFLMFFGWLACTWFWGFCGCVLVVFHCKSFMNVCCGICEKVVFSIQLCVFCSVVFSCLGIVDGGFLCFLLKFLLV